MKNKIEVSTFTENSEKPETSCEPAAKTRKIEKIRVLPVLSEAIVCETVPSIPFLVLMVQNKRFIGEIIKHLDELPDNLKHLKRIRKDGCLLFAENQKKASVILKKLEGSNIEILSENLNETLVPKQKPATRKQFENAKNLWPTSYHPNQYVDSLLDGSFLTRDFENYIQNWANYASITEQCIAVQNQTIIIEAKTSSTSPIRHAIMEMVGKMPNREPSSENYLGTGCDVFVVNEPCAMCAMALVHFRVKRVFFIKNTSDGVFNSNGWQIHLEPSINHHYEVFQIIFEHSSTKTQSKTIISCGHFS